VIGLVLGRERSLTISLAVCIQDTKVTDRQTDDRQTDTGRQQRPRLRIAWRGKNDSRRVSQYIIIVDRYTVTGEITFICTPQEASIRPS